jgi:hypothetical protein
MSFAVIPAAMAWAMTLTTSPAVMPPPVTMSLKHNAIRFGHTLKEDIEDATNREGGYEHNGD